MILRSRGLRNICQNRLGPLSSNQIHSILFPHSGKTLPRLKPLVQHFPQAPVALARLAARLDKILLMGVRAASGHGAIASVVKSMLLVQSCSWSCFHLLHRVSVPVLPPARSQCPARIRSTTSVWRSSRQPDTPTAAFRTLFEVGLGFFPWPRGRPHHALGLDGALDLITAGQQSCVPGCRQKTAGRMQRRLAAIPRRRLDSL